MKLVKLILSVVAVTVLGAGLAYADGGLMGRIWGSEDKPEAVQHEQGDHVRPAAEHSESDAVKGQKTEEEMSRKSAHEKEVKQVKEMKETKTVKEECPSEAKEKKECDEQKKESNGEKKECDEESTKKESESKK